MKRNPNYDIWKQNIQKMNEQELQDALLNSGGYHPEYIELLKERLITEFHHSNLDLDETQKVAEAKYKTEKIIAETDRPLSMTGKALVIVGLIFLQWFAVFYVLIKRNWKVRNSLGEKRYLYDEAARKWLLNCIFSFLFVWGILYFAVMLLNMT